MGRAAELFEKIKAEGRSAIEQFIRTRKAEELVLDFKRSADNGTGTHLHDNDRKNLAKAISGFGNSEGGLVVWGIQCSGDANGVDLAEVIRPITDAQRFVGWLEGAVSGCTIPPHTTVMNCAVLTGVGTDGIAVTYVPKSEVVPLQDVVTKHYYIRAGSSFSHTPHDVLAGMFGRRPQPSLKANFGVPPILFAPSEDRLTVGIEFIVRNEGPGFAKDVFVSISMLSLCRAGAGFYHTPPPNGFTRTGSAGCHCVVSEADFRLPPKAHLSLVEISFDLRPPFDRGLHIEGLFGFGNAPPRSFVFKNSQQAIEAWYREVLEEFREGRVGPSDHQRLVSTLLCMESSVIG